MASKSRQKGQATLEYVMLLAIAVLIILGSIYQYNDAFRLWAQAYFVGEDSYLGCLIKEGALPGDQNSTCEKPEFSFAAGRRKDQGLTLPPSQSSSSSSSSSSFSPLDPSSSSTTSSSKSPGRVNESRIGGVGSTIPFSNSLEKSAFQGSNPKKPEDRQSTGRGGRGLLEGMDFAAVENSGLISSTGGGELIQSSRRSAKSQLIPFSDKKRKTAREIAKEKAEKKLQEDQAREWNLAMIIKFIVIGALIFLILFFIGSQIFAVSRGQRRR